MLIQIPWTIPPELQTLTPDRNWFVTLPSPGAVEIHSGDFETGEIWASILIEPYDLEDYPGFYFASPPIVEQYLPFLSPYYVATDLGMEFLFPARWQALLYLRHFPSFYGYADNVDQILEYGRVFVESPEPVIVTMLPNMLYNRKNGPYIGEEEVRELDEDWETPTGNEPELLLFHFMVLSPAPWSSKMSAVERLMRREIAADIDFEEVLSESTTPWRQHVRHRLAEEDLDLEEEEKRLRTIFKERS